MASGVITGVLALLFTVFYVGANIDPVGHMKKLPVGLVNADKGAAVGGKQVNLGAQITESIKKSTAGGDKIDWFLAEFEPLRQITGGVRSILYYDAQADAGLTRGWVMMAAGLLAAALFGFGVTGWYDRRGLHRIPAATKPEKTAALA
ncbi:DUF3533 domain-containing protein [Streptomyces sp. NPDC096040]|uniref:YhgE/Pip domain-containing protein n=1 Tax=Streptomyces sp. NPDC096040 TaxID=3155541 RepID=UPI00331D8292